jgi:glycosyltransferase involved in cell wall biosynthesis
VLTEHEPGAAAGIEIARAARGAARPLMFADALAWKRYERRVLRRADAVVALTERDRRVLGQLVPDERLRVIPLTTSLPAEPLDPAGTDPPRVVFVGNFSHPPNVAAAAKLVHAIFPAVLLRRPDARLELIGDRAPPWLTRGSWRGVTVTGRVPDVTPYLDRAAVVVAPVDTGGGLRVKVLEALAHGKALVASPLAVEGIALIDGRQYLRADGESAFSDAVALLLEDERRRIELGHAAREWAEANLGWEGTVAAYEALYGELLRARRRR